MANKKIYRKGLLHHVYRFGFFQNINVWFCRTFGHSINTNADYFWCERCGMEYSEIYSKQLRGKYDKENERK